ncbi:hypothetical protein [Micromonospora sp. NPDC001898]
MNDRAKRRHASELRRENAGETRLRIAWPRPGSSAGSAAAA